MRSLSSRRAWLGQFGAAALPFITGEFSKMTADPLGLPIGLELYTVGKEMDADPHGTLKQVAAAGYKEVELSPLSRLGAKETKSALDESGLKNPAGHYLLQDLLKDLPGKIDFAKEMGQEYVVLTVPWVADPSRFTPDPKLGPYAMFMAVIQGLTLDDFKWNAEQFNKLGAELKKSGLQLAYHNHNFEFKKCGDTTGYDELLRLTDPELVKFELDCGWVTVAGHSPVEYLHKHANRYRLLHIKDFKPGFTPTNRLGQTGEGAPVPTELGRGVIDYKPIFAPAKNCHIRSYFVEQEPPFTEMPALAAIKVDYDYLHNLHA